MTVLAHCRDCDDLRPHDHIHDAAHGIVGTHMSGSERFICIVCGLKTFAKDDGASDFVFILDTVKMNAKKK